MTAVGEFGRRAIGLGFILPGEQKQRPFRQDENDSRQPQNEHEQAIDHVSVFGNVAWKPNVAVGRDKERQHTENRHG
jgi:hypothetical protein